MPWIYDSISEKMVDADVYRARKREGTKRASRAIPMPYVRGDIKPYTSPVTGKTIDGRAARREDLARSGCREVDPSERPVYRNYEFCQKYRRPYMGGDIPPPMSRDEKAQARWRKAQEKKAEAANEAVLKARAAKNSEPDAPVFRGHLKKAPLFDPIRKTT